MMSGPSRAEPRLVRTGRLVNTELDEQRLHLLHTMSMRLSDKKSTLPAG